MNKDEKLKQLLKEGYLAMAEEARQLLEEFKYADEESLKYIDGKAPGY